MTYSHSKDDSTSRFQTSVFSFLRTPSIFTFTQHTFYIFTITQHTPFIFTFTQDTRHWSIYEVYSLLKSLPFFHINHYNTQNHYHRATSPGEKINITRQFTANKTTTNITHYFKMSTAIYNTMPVQFSACTVSFLLACYSWDVLTAYAVWNSTTSSFKAGFEDRISSTYLSKFLLLSTILTVN